VLNANTGAEFRARERLGRFFSASLSPSLKQLAVGNGYRSPKGIGVFDTATGLRERFLPDLFAGDLAYSPDGGRVAGAGEGVLRIWDAENWSLVRTISVPNMASPMKWSPDGRRLFIGSGKTLIAYDAETGSEIRRYWTGGGVDSLAVHPDGRIFFSDRSKFVHVLDGETGAELARFENPTDFRRSRGSRAIALSRDGRRLYSGDWGKMLVWDVPKR
jgi:WD40 repeat protein